MCKRAKFRFIVFLMLAIPATVLSQEHIQQDSIDSTQKKWDINIDIVSMYLWRGQSWGGRYTAVQPSFNYAVSKRWSVGVWATTNFKKKYYENDGLSPRGYQELDFGITYQIADFMSVSVWDYYWPTYERFEGVDQNYFNYRPNGVKTVDATIEFDFSDGFKYPFNATISTLIGGNDYQFDENNQSYTRNFTTYVEAGYTFSDIFRHLSAKTFRNIDLCPAVGAVLNNKAEYYTYGDYDRISFINLALAMSREFDLGYNIAMPVSVNYTHNAAKANTQIIGKNFVTVGVSFYWK